MKANCLRVIQLVMLALVMTNIVVSGSFANEIQDLDIKINQSYLNVIDFNNQFYFADKKSIRYTNLPIDNKSAALEWSPDTKKIGSDSIFCK